MLLFWHPDTMVTLRLPSQHPLERKAQLHTDSPRLPGLLGLILFTLFPPFSPQEKNRRVEVA